MYYSHAELLELIGITEDVEGLIDWEQLPVSERPQWFFASKSYLCFGVAGSSVFPPLRRAESLLRAMILSY